MNKLYWKNSYRFQRIMEILEDYWLTEPDELYVKVDMTFVKADGQHQRKTINWFNPNYEVVKSGYKVPDEIPYEEIINFKNSDNEIPYLKEIQHGEIRRKRRTIDEKQNN